MLFTRQRTLELFVISVISTLALVLRLWGLNTKEFWYDEAYTGIMLKLPYGSLNNLLMHDVHPPVYIHLLRAWTFILGDSDFNIRLLSVVTGVLLVIASYFLVKSLVFSKRYPSAKLIIPLVIAVNPFFVEYSKEARSYSLVTLIFSILFISYCFASKSLRFNFKWLITALLIILAFLTHYLIAVGVFCLFLFDAFFTKDKSISLKEFILKKSQLYLSLGTIISLPLYFYLPTILTQYKNAPLMWWIPISDLQRLPATMYIFLFGVKPNILGIPQPLQLSPNISSQDIGISLLILFSVVLTYTLVKLRKIEIRKEFILLLFSSVVAIGLVMLMQLFGNRLFLERYLIPYALIFVILFTMLIFTFKKVIKYLIVGLYTIMSFSLIFNVTEEATGYAKLAKELGKIRTQEVQVIMPDPVSFTITKYYLDNENIKLKIYDPKEDLTDWEIISKEEILKDYEQLKDKHRIWVYSNSQKPTIWYTQNYQVDKLYVYSSIRMFDDLASIE